MLFLLFLINIWTASLQQNIYILIHANKIKMPLRENLNISKLSRLEHQQYRNDIAYMASTFIIQYNTIQKRVF